jgi:hypothetical protein
MPACGQNLRYRLLVQVFWDQPGFKVSVSSFNSASNRFRALRCARCSAGARQPQGPVLSFPDTLGGFRALVLAPKHGDRLVSRVLHDGPLVYPKLGAIRFPSQSEYSVYLVPVGDPLLKALFVVQLPTLGHDLLILEERMPAPAAHLDLCKRKLTLGWSGPLGLNLVATA